MWTKFIGFLVKVFVKPFLDALRSETGLLNNKEVSLDKELKELLSSVSKERLEILLKDELSKKVLELESTVKLLEEHVKSLEALINKVAVDANSKMQVLGRRLLTIERNRPVKKQVKQSKPREVETQVLEF